MPYLVMYARVVDDKDIGILMTGIYFGGIAEHETEADEIARKCVAINQGGTAIPKIIKIRGNDLPSTMRVMTESFDRLAERMYENESTVDRSR